MPEEQKTNEEVIQQQKAQDVSGPPVAPNVVNDDTVKALSELRNKIAQEKQESPVVVPTEGVKELKKEVKEGAGGGAKEGVGEEVKEGAGEGAKEGLGEGAKEGAGEVEDWYKGPQLPSGASVKSHEAFASIKERASQELQKRNEQIAKLTAELAELQKRMEHPVPLELEEELKAHREFRTKLDIDFDPRFKQFDVEAAQIEEFIYAQLRKSPNITEDVIEQIKKYGGPTKVRMDKILETVNDATIRDLVGRKLADIEVTAFNKEQAIRAAKENVSQYLTERQKTWEAAATAHNTATENELAPIVDSLDWFGEREIPANADQQTKTAAEEHNKFIQETQEQLEVALMDDSPKMRAILLAGMVQLFWLQRQEAASKAAIETLRKELKEANDKLGRFKQASVTRLQETGAVSAGVPPAPKEEELINLKTVDALGRLRAQIAAEKAQAAAR